MLGTSSLSTGLVPILKRGQDPHLVHLYFNGLFQRWVPSLGCELGLHPCVGWVLWVLVWLSRPPPYGVSIHPPYPHWVRMWWSQKTIGSRWALKPIFCNLFIILATLAAALNRTMINALGIGSLWWSVASLGRGRSLHVKETISTQKFVDW